jgi:hypothetical protein
MVMYHVIVSTASYPQITKGSYMSLERSSEELVKDMKEWKRRFMYSGKLTEAEANELVNFEIVTGPTGLEQQLRRYYLLVKRDCEPRTAKRMWKKVFPLIRKGASDEQSVHDVSVVLEEFVSGFVIYMDEMPEAKAEESQTFPLPLRTITQKASRPFQVYDAARLPKSRVALWKAWRQGRPTVLGYGMTEEDAIRDLKYNVQPDHDGTLDGEGKPKGPVIGGNMLFSRNQIMSHNQGRFR